MEKNNAKEVQSLPQSETLITMDSDEQAPEEVTTQPAPLIETTMEAQETPDVEGLSTAPSSVATETTMQPTLLPAEQTGPTKVIAEEPKKSWSTLFQKNRFATHGMALDYIPQ